MPKSAAPLATEVMMSREGNSSKSMSMSGLSLRKADKAFAKKVLVAVLLA